MTKSLLFILMGLLFFGCAQKRIKRYQSMLDPKVNESKKEELDKLLGPPVSCSVEVGGLNKCEYRTAAGRNQPTPAAFRKSKTMKIDVSPFQQFDVLHLYYDSDRILKQWEPVVLTD